MTTSSARVDAPFADLTLEEGRGAVIGGGGAVMLALREQFATRQPGIGVVAPQILGGKMSAAIARVVSGAAPRTPANNAVMRNLQRWRSGQQAPSRKTLEAYRARAERDPAVASALDALLDALKPGVTVPDALGRGTMRISVTGMINVISGGKNRKVAADIRERTVTLAIPAARQASAQADPLAEWIRQFQQEVEVELLEISAITVEYAPRGE